MLNKSLQLSHKKYVDMDTLPQNTDAVMEDLSVISQQLNNILIRCWMDEGARCSLISAYSPSFRRQLITSTLLCILFLMNWKACQVGETTLSLHVFSDPGGCEAMCCKGKAAILISWLCLHFLNFLLFLISFPGETKTTRTDSVSSVGGGQDMSWVCKSQV